MATGIYKLLSAQNSLQFSLNNLLRGVALFRIYIMKCEVNYSLQEGWILFIRMTRVVISGILDNLSRKF